MSCDSFQFLSKYLLEELDFANDALALIGIAFLARSCIRRNIALVDFFKTHIWSKRNAGNFIDLCGGDWAVVTGSSEGIGRAYAEELAKRGLNIVLISNDVKPLHQTAIDLNEKYGVKVDFICLTFDGEVDKYDRIREALAGKAIGILVNNVGVMYDYPQMFLDVPAERLWQLFNVNVAATTMMTHMILPQMVERGRGAVVNMSAGACSRPTPQMTVYAATKAYVDLFSRSLDYEYGCSGITVQCLMPFYVATRMQKFSRTLSRPSKLIPTAEEYARHAVLTLGYSSRTTGYWIHTIQGWLAHLLPQWLWMWLASRLNHSLRQQAREKVRSRSYRSISEAIS